LLVALEITKALKAVAAAQMKAMWAVSESETMRDRSKKATVDMH
jgi:hypothetical protein